MNRFSPSEAALEGFRLTRERPTAILTWCLVYLLGIIAIAALMMAILGPEFIAMAQKGDLLENPEAFAKFLTKSAPAFLLLLVMTIGLMSILTTGIYRIILRPEQKSFAYLRLGADELRLTVVNLALFAVGVGCLIAGFIVVEAGRVAGPLVELIGIAVVGAVTVWIGVRLSMVTPMTFSTRRISLAPAWQLTRGSFWRLFGMIVLAVIFYVMILLLVNVIGVALITLAGGQQVLNNIQALTAPVIIVGLVTLAVQLIVGVLQVVMIYAPFAVAYEQLHGDASVDPLRLHKVLQE